MLNYTVSECGEVYSLSSNRVLKPQLSNAGYYRVQLSGQGESRKKYLVHRLVAQAYLPNPDCRPQVNHKDGNKLNNCVDNLEWTTVSQNIQHAMDTGLNKGVRILTDADVLKIVASSLSNKVLAEYYNVTSTAIYNIRAGKSYAKLTGLDRAPTRGKLSPAQVIAIYTSQEPIEELAVKYNKTVRMIYQIKSGKSWGYITQKL